MIHIIIKLLHYFTNSPEQHNKPRILLPLSVVVNNNKNNVNLVGGLEEQSNLPVENLPYPPLPSLQLPHLYSLTPLALLQNNIIITETYLLLPLQLPPSSFPPTPPPRITVSRKLSITSSLNPTSQLNP